MAVVFKTFDQIEIDGIASGNIVDVISNHAPKRLQVLEAYKVFTDKLNADHATALATAEADLATTSSQLEATTQAKTALDLRVATLTNEKQALADDVSVKTEQLALADSEYKLLETKVAFLESIRTYNPRILKGKAFYKRISQSDMEILLTSEIPQLVTVGKTILAYRDNDWPIIIDSDDFQTLVGYVYMSGTFDTEEVASIMRDATRDEAYIT
jgi:hypothetical protein